ncbi:MAG: SpoIIE family protein phosphatase [Planctomycetia bacterium]|nr:SpoIIE family protein phosphatase [Planctomycetia bacterium]
MASLLTLKGATPGQRLTLDGKDPVTLGRAQTCTMVLESPAVSRVHALIKSVNGKLFIEDGDGKAPSRNGTYVNNQAITAATPLKDNDRIKICEFLFTFHDQPVRPPLPAWAEGGEGEGNTDEDGEGTSTVEATLSRQSTNQLLEAQPAEKIAALLEISTYLARTLELDTLMPRIAESLFQLFKQADRCFLILRDPADAAKLIPKMIKTRRAGGETSARFSRTIVKVCLDSASAQLFDDASSAPQLALAQSVADFRIRSVMVAPLCSATDGKPFGVIQLDTQDRSKKFTQDDLKLLLGVANQGAVALENVQLHTSLVTQERSRRDMELAKQVQRSFLPQTLPKLPGYQFYAHYEPALVIGGDYYDFMPVDGRQVTLLGDVAGKGVSAALLMAKLSALARFCMLTEPEPAAAITKLNDELLLNDLLDKFVTLAAVVLDPAKHQVTVVNAGHVTPMIYRQFGGKLEDAIEAESCGLPLGVMPGYKYTSVQAELRPGDSLLLFTDGVTDAQNNQPKPTRFEMSGVYETVQQARPVPGEPITATQLGERLIKAVKQFSVGTNQYDDIALVCFGRVP